jgi:aspartate racemase
LIGLIGGLGVGAGVHYYRELAAAHEAIGRPLELTMVHAQMSRVFEHASSGNYHGLAAYLADLLSKLKAAGATIGVIPAMTPHICADELLPITPLPIVNLIDVVRAELAERDLKRVALFGTRFVVESDLFGRLDGVDVVRPKPEEITFIHDTYTQLARTGSATPQQSDQLIATARTLCDRDGAEAIVLAGTDLATLFNESNTPFPHLDCARAHIRAIMRAIDDR